jgi:hypothetical protein
MLTAEVIGPGRTTGEVRPARFKMGWNCSAEAGQDSRDGDYAAMKAPVAPCCLPVDLDFGYSAVSWEWMGLPYGKGRFKQLFYIFIDYLRKSAECRLI